MKTLLVLVLASQATFARPVERPSFWTAQWKITTDLLSAGIRGALEDINQRQRPVDAETVGDLGELLAALNVLAQRPCRRDEASCRRALDQIMIESVRRPFAEVPALSAGAVPLRRQLIDHLRDQVHTEALARATVGIEGRWRAAPAMRRLAYLQAGLFVSGVSLVAGLVANYLGVSVEHAIGTQVAAAVAATGVAYLVSSHLPLTKLNSALKSRRNLVAKPARACLDALTTAEINRAALRGPR